jgi:hypothetical protein
MNNDPEADNWWQIGEIFLGWFLTLPVARYNIRPFVSRSVEYTAF